MVNMGAGRRARRGRGLAPFAIAALVAGITLPMGVSQSFADGAGTPACATTPGFPSLGAAGEYTVFALNSGTKQNVNFSLVTVNGDVAVASGATVKNQAPSKVNGNVSVAAGGSFSGPGKVSGKCRPG